MRSSRSHHAGPQVLGHGEGPMLPIFPFIYTLNEQEIRILTDCSESAA